MKNKNYSLATLFAFVFLLSSHLPAQLPGNCLDFDGANDQAQGTVPSLFANIPTQDITVEAWIYPRQAAFQRIVYAQVSTSMFFNFAFSAGNSIYFYVNDGGTTYSVTTSSATLPLNQWSHVACRWRASTNTVEMLFNGVPVATVGGGGSSTGSSGLMTIGSRPGGAQYFNGRIDEVRIWSSYRADCDIFANYQAEFPSGSQPNLVAYYDFNQGVPGGTNTTVTTLPDESGNTNNLTLSGFSLSGGSSNWLGSGAGVTSTGPFGTGAVVTDSVSVCPGTSYTFPGGNTQTITSPVTQQDTLTSSGGCDSIITTVVSLNPTFLQNQTASVCVGDSFTFPDGTTQLITGNVTYTSNLSTSQGCDSVITSTISTHPSYQIIDTVEVCGPQAYTFPDGFSQTLFVTTTHVSNLTASTGCDSIIETTVVINGIYSLSDSIEACPGETVIFPDGSSQVINNSTTYTSYMTSSHGCDSAVTTIVEMVSIDTSVTLAGYTLTAGNATGTYQWIDCDNGNQPIAGATGQSFTAQSQGTYAVIVTDMNCSDTSGCHTVIILAAEDEQLSQIRVYPNPAEDLLHIEAGTVLNGRLEVVNPAGQVVREQALKGAEAEVNVADLAAGLYLVRIFLGGRMQHIRFVKQ